MLDLETLSTTPNSAIIAIGAVKFDPRGAVGTLGDPADPEYKHFDMAIEFESVTAGGFDISGSTIKWWFQQSADARGRVVTGDTDIATVLHRFWEWFGHTSMPVWGNGAGFDNVVLRQAYMKLAGVAPWSFRDDRCFRTMKALFPMVPYDPPVVPHWAVSDAQAQAVHLQKLFNRLNFAG
jgi:hypothetical protein